MVSGAISNWWFSMVYFELKDLQRSHFSGIGLGFSSTVWLMSFFFIFLISLECGCCLFNVGLDLESNLCCSLTMTYCGVDLDVICNTDCRRKQGWVSQFKEELW